MLIDLHVHTSRYSACGRGTPEEMVVGAIQVGLEALVFTEHNFLWPADDLASLQARFPQIKLLRGIEVTSAEGDDFLVYGPTEPELFHARMEAGELIRRARESGGVVVLAHPYRYRPQAPNIIEQYPIDGVEILSYNILNYAHPRACVLAERLGAFRSAASDAHHPEALGLYAMQFARRPTDEEELAQAFRGRQFSLCANAQKVAASNARLESMLIEVRQLIALGYDDEGVRDRAPGVSLTIVRGVREGLDVLRPTLDGNLPRQLEPTSE